MIDRSPSLALVGAVHERLDAMGTWTSTARDHAGSRVWRVDLPGRCVYVKQHHQARKRRQEVTALREWTPRLVARFRVPVLIADLPAFEAVVMTAVPGDEADKRPPADVPGAWTAAGRVLRALHDLPHEDTDPVPIADALAARTASWCGRAEGRVPSAIVDAVRRGAQVSGGRRVPCHRDFQPRNWLIDGADLGIVDWEHASPDLAEADLVRVAALWADDSALHDAFLAGYGPMAPESAERLDRLVPLFGLATLVWALEHRDPAFEEAGRAILDRAL